MLRHTYSFLFVCLFSIWLAVFFLCSSISESEHLFFCLLSICVLSLENYLFTSFAHYFRKIVRYVDLCEYFKYPAWAWFEGCMDFKLYSLGRWSCSSFYLFIMCAVMCKFVVLMKSNHMSNRSSYFNLFHIFLP